MGRKATEIEDYSWMYVTHTSLGWSVEDRAMAIIASFATKEEAVIFCLANREMIDLPLKKKDWYYFDEKGEISTGHRLVDGKIRTKYIRIDRILYCYDLSLGLTHIFRLKQAKCQEVEKERELDPKRSQ